MFLLIYLLMVVETLFWQVAHHQGAAAPVWSVLFGWPLGAAIAVVVSARSGLTLPLRKRLARYVYIAAAAGLLFLSLDIAGVRPFGLYTTWQGGGLGRIESVGPHARYALVPFPDGHMHMVSVAGGKACATLNARTPIPSQSEPLGLSYQGLGWADANTVYSLNKVHTDTAQPENAITIVSIDNRGPTPRPHPCPSPHHQGKG